MVAEGTTASMPPRYRRSLTTDVPSAHPRRNADVDHGRREGLARPDRLRLGRGCALIDGADELEHGRPERRVRLREHERRARIEGTDRAAVFIDDLVVDVPAQRALGVLDVDARERIRAIEHQ